MAEKKFGDLGIAIIFGIFIIGGFTSVLIDFDGQVTNAENLGNVLDKSYNETSGSYLTTEQELYQSQYNSSVFTLTTGSDVDVRGTSEVIKSTKESPSTIITFFNNIKDKIFIDYKIILMLGSLVVLTGIILFIRFLRPGGA